MDSKLKLYQDSQINANTTKLNNEQLLEKYISVIKFHAADILRKIPLNSNIEYNDLVNSGVIGLILSYERFDPSKETTFKTFAGFRIRGSMLDYLRDSDHKPRSIRAEENDIKYAIKSLARKLDRHISEDDIAKELDISIGEYRKRLDTIHGSEVIYYDDLNLNVGDESEALSFIDNVKDDGSKCPTYFIELNDLSKHLEEAIDSIPMKQQILIDLYYIEELSMKEISIVFGNTESRISQILKEITLKLRSFMEKNGYLYV